MTTGSDGGIVDNNDKNADGRCDECDDGGAIGCVEGLGSASNSVWLDCSDSSKKSLNDRLIDSPRTPCETYVEAE